MSVLRINQNIIAMNANRNLRITGSALGRSLERLSSGLRINRAADDVAGLAISERLRAQIRGLNRASANALDGISLIQTAEGSLNEVNTMLQRMRELSVQAANGVLTSSDRIAIQYEVNQLLDEIDRIASTTEFNTRNLLDGSMGALAATDDPTMLRAAVVGNVGKGGNFILNLQVIDNGKLQVQKTAPFAKLTEADAVGSVNYLTTYMSGAEIITAGGDKMGDTGVVEVAVTNIAANVITGMGGKDMQFYTLDPDGVGGDNTLSFGQAANVAYNCVNFQDVNNGDFIQFSFVLANVDPNKVFVSHISFAAADAGLQFNTLAGMAAAMSVMFTNNGALAADCTTLLSAEGQISIVNAGNNVQIKGMKLIDGTLGAPAVSLGVQSPSKMFFSFSKFGTNEYVSNIVWGGINYRASSDGTRISFANADATHKLNRMQYLNAGAWTTMVNDSANNYLDLRLSTKVYDANNLGAAKGYAANGVWSKVSTNISNKVDTIRTNPTTYSVNELQKYGQVFQVAPPPISGNYLLSAVSATSYCVYNFNNEKYDASIRSGRSKMQAVEDARGAKFVISSAAFGAVTGVSFFHIGQAFNGDDANDGTGAGLKLKGVRVVFDATLQRGEQAIFEVSTTPAVAASQSDRLRTINRFIDYGVFDGRENVELQVYVRGSRASGTIQFSANDTMEQFCEKVSLAMADFLRNDDLNMETAINPAQAPDLVHLNVIGQAKGTISITTPIVGKELVFAGDDKIMRALGLTTIQDARVPIYSVVAKNLETGSVVGNVRTDSNEINGLLPGLRLFFDPAWKFKLDPTRPLGDANKEMVSFPYMMPMDRPQLSLTTTDENLFLHIVPRGLTLQIGANQGQYIRSTINSMDTESLGVRGLIVVDEAFAQDAMSRVNIAIDRVTSERSKLGAIQNRLEATIRNLDVASENLTASESRIRDVDIADETVKSTRNQILLQAGTAALAQANQLPQAVLQLLR